MKNFRQQIGARGEQMAKAYLEAAGFQIIACNWRYKRAEIDIIAREGDFLVFVEVKTRKNERNGPPEAFVSTRKQRLMASAASAYCASIAFSGELRFDVVSVLFSKKDYHITLIRDAFFPGLSS